MLKVSLIVVLAVLAVCLADPRVQQHRGLTAAAEPGGHPYLFLTVPRGRGGSVVQGFEVLEEDVDDKLNAANDDDDDDEAENDDEDDEPIVGFVQQGASRAAISDEDLDDDDDDENDDDDETMDSNDVSNMVQVVGPKKPATLATPSNLQMILQNAKPTQMMVSKEHAGAIMVPDGIIEIEGQRIIDQKTGKASLLVPREALDAIPDGSVVALMERSAGDLTDEDEEERANRVIVRRRRRGSRRNVRRRGGNRNRRRRIQINNNNRNRNGNRNRNKRRRVNRRNVRVVRKGNGNGNRNNNRRRRGNRRRVSNNRPVVIQG